MPRHSSYSALAGSSSTAALPLHNSALDSEDLSDLEGATHRARRERSLQEDDGEEDETDGEGRQGLLSGEKSEVRDLEEEGVLLEGKSKRWLGWVQVSTVGCRAAEAPRCWECLSTILQTFEAAPSCSSPCSPTLRVAVLAPDHLALTPLASHPLPVGPHLPPIITLLLPSILLPPRHHLIYSTRFGLLLLRIQPLHRHVQQGGANRSQPLAFGWQVWRCAVCFGGR